MKKLDILVDADDCLYNTLPAFLDEYNRITSESVQVEEIKEWDMCKYLKHPELIKEIFQRPEFFVNLKLKEKAKSVMKILNRHFNVYIATAGQTKCLTGKELAFKRDLPFISKEQIVYGWYKGLYKADVIIDDRVIFHRQFQKTNPDGVSIMFDMPHNQTCDVKHKRVNNWESVLEIIMNYASSNGLGVMTIGESN